MAFTKKLTPACKELNYLKYFTFLLFPLLAMFLQVAHALNMVTNGQSLSFSCSSISIRPLHQIA